MRGIKAAFKFPGQRTLNKSHSQPTPSESTPSKSTPSESGSTKEKEQDLLAFRTIITMLACIQSPKGGRPPGAAVTVNPIFGKSHEDLAALRLLDALSTVLIREHEITAVMATPYDGENIPVLASVVHPTVEPSQSDFSANPDVGPGFWSRMLDFSHFTVSMNPRTDKINNNTDSLMNKSPLPIIGDYEHEIPRDLVQASSEGNVSLLDVYLGSYWGKETFETHSWMLKTLLRQSVLELPNKNAYINYVIAASYRKMNLRMTKVTAYYDCLQNLKAFPFTLPPEEPKEDRRGADWSFIVDIRSLADLVDTSIPNLKQQAANLFNLVRTTEPNSNVTEEHRPGPHAQAIGIYNESTCIEFHSLLCELLTRFKKSLNNLVTLKKRNPAPTVGEIRKALSTVRILGTHLRVMARSSAIETHFQTISRFLDVDDKKLWTPEPDDADFSEFQDLKPYSMRKGKSLLPWESYRDWLMLMVHYFDAASVLNKHMRSLSPNATISITIMSPPLPDRKMLTWIEVLKSDRFFPKLETEAPGEDFIKFLQGNLDSDNSDDNTLATSDHRDAHFYHSLKKGPLFHGTFSGKPHAEAYMSSLITSGHQCDQCDQCDGHFNPISESPDKSLTFQDRRRIKELLVKIKNCQHAIGVSKRCCPVCAYLLSLLNGLEDRNGNAKFVISDEHSHITSCTLPKWLPGDIVYSMVVEFSRRLRVELTRLQSTSYGQARGHGPTRSSDTGRMSVNSNVTQESDDEEEQTEAFSETYVRDTT